jgi:branched-chain amino acid transport system ATP-binding protein
MSALLRIEGLRAGYQGSLVLQGVDLELEAGRALALLGRNGVGKTTTVLTIMGLVRAQGGSVALDGTELVGLRPDQIARRGIGLVPQGRRVFAPLTVDENLRVAAGRKERGPWTRARVYETLPQLAGRRHHRGDQLSGGEQQMLAIGRALLCNPRLLLLDEPSDGLAPVVVEQITELARSLCREGMAVLLVEQDLNSALALVDDVAVMQKGEIVHRTGVEDFTADPDRARQLLGIA